MQYPVAFLTNWPGTVTFMHSFQSVQKTPAPYWKEIEITISLPLEEQQNRVSVK